MLTLLLGTLAITQLVTLIGLGYTSLRLRTLSSATVRSEGDSALIGAVEELLLELEDQTARALEELGLQRTQIDAILRETEQPETEAAATQRTPSRRRSQGGAGATRRGGDSDAVAERRRRAAELFHAGYAERDIARELRVGVDEVRLLLATAARREGA